MDARANIHVNKDEMLIELPGVFSMTLDAEGIEYALFDAAKGHWVPGNYDEPGAAIAEMLAAVPLPA